MKNETLTTAPVLTPDHAAWLLKRGFTQDRTNALAHEFAAILRQWLTEEEMGLVNRANAEEENSLVCHSGDFCDSNEAMALAFETVFGIPVDPQSDEHATAWNAAWTLAKTNRFSPDNIPST